ncbi:hypothetical protein ACN2XU_23945 [Primorskyibacter sp. 2E107]|uniref:hypothetical protein n=1 Tax=Primorskyibacter sp. 2E107 TaxID=3403458 RepID=UPI003AF6CE0A
MRDFAATNPDEGLLIAQGTPYDILGPDIQMTRHALDAMEPDRPLIAFDFYTDWANTPALRAAGLLDGRDVGAGNEVATGELREKNA